MFLACFHCLLSNENELHFDMFNMAALLIEYAEEVLL